MQHLDPHERPPDSIRAVYKKYQKMKAADLDADRDIIDPERQQSRGPDSRLRVIDELSDATLSSAFYAFAEMEVSTSSENSVPPVRVYEHQDMPGLHILPTLLPPPIQSALLSRLLHRDLSNPQHLTNVHTHHRISYPSAHLSFFSLSPTSRSPVATPLDPSIHKPLTASQLLSKKLRWATLGGQYDWTAKRYPNSSPPPFPADVRQLLGSVFPQTHAEAAILNLYSPGDTLSVHRDVAEQCSTGLVSVSLGCDAIFVIGTVAPTDPADAIVSVLRLRSGSAVYMSGAARFAWHGVPQIVKGTCPEYLKDWPAVDGADGESESAEYEAWRGWMAGKRINLNVRQMRD